MDESPSGSNLSSESAVSSWPTLSDNRGGRVQENADGLILSQQKKQETLKDPVPYFEILGRIVTKRANAI